MDELLSTKEVLAYITDLLTQPKPRDIYKVAARAQDDPEFAALTGLIDDLRLLSASLNQGNLDKMVTSKGYVLSNLKALQANLRHLTWQTKRIAEGDFTQKVDFLGDFSKSFNEMTAKLEDNSKKLQEMALLDHLTKTSNRHFLMLFLDKCFEKYLRDREAFCIIMLDIDHFKKINDTYGHAAGDEVLVHLSSLLKRQFRSSDVLARYGGEEFLAVLVDTPLDAAMGVAGRLLRAVKSLPIPLGDAGTINITVSIGVSQAGPADNHYEDIIKRSDEALYAAKNAGRDRVEVRHAPCHGAISGE